jgi:thiamine-monophosphate kinase
MRRAGAADGDLIYVIGNMGTFWSAILHKLKTPDLGLSISEKNLADEALTRPVPRLQEAMILAKSGLVTSCMDASDGVLGSLMELGRFNHTNVNLDASVEPVSLVRKVAAELGIPPLKLMLSWGDWQLVVTIRNESQRAFDGLMKSTGIPAALVGRMMSGDGGRVFGNFQGRSRQLANLSSERFSERSYFTRGMQAHVEWFLHAPLLAGESA